MALDDVAAWQRPALDGGSSILQSFGVEEFGVAAELLN